MTQTKDLLEITISNENAGDCPVGTVTYKGVDYVLGSRSTDIELSDAILGPDITTYRTHNGLFDCGITKFCKRCSGTQKVESIEVDFGSSNSISVQKIIDGVFPDPVEELLRRKQMVIEAFEQLHPKVKLTFTQKPSPSITTHKFERNTYGLEITLDSKRPDNQITKARIYDSITGNTLNEWLTHEQIINNLAVIKRVLIIRMTGFICLMDGTYTDGFFGTRMYTYRQTFACAGDKTPLEFNYQRNFGKNTWDITNLRVDNVDDSFDELNSYFEDFDKKVQQVLQSELISTHTIVIKDVTFTVTLDNTKAGFKITSFSITNKDKHVINKWTGKSITDFDTSQMKHEIIKALTGFRLIDSTSLGLFARSSNATYTEINTDCTSTPFTVSYLRKEGVFHWRLTDLTKEGIIDDFKTLEGYIDDFNAYVEKQRKLLTDNYFLVKDDITVSLIWNNHHEYVQDIRLNGCTCPVSRAEGTNARMVWLLTELLKVKTPLRVEVLKYDSSSVSVQIAHDVTFDIYLPNNALRKIHQLDKAELRDFLNNLLALVTTITRKINEISKSVNQPFK